jgi:hypothetical protein
MRLQACTRCGRLHYPHVTCEQAALGRRLTTMFAVHPDDRRRADAAETLAIARWNLRRWKR